MKYRRSTKKTRGKEAKQEKKKNASANATTQAMTVAVDHPNLRRSKCLHGGIILMDGDQLHMDILSFFEKFSDLWMAEDSSEKAKGMIWLKQHYQHVIDHPTTVRVAYSVAARSLLSEGTGNSDIDEDCPCPNWKEAKSWMVIAMFLSKGGMLHKDSATDMMMDFEGTEQRSPFFGNVIKDYLTEAGSMRAIVLHVDEHTPCDCLETIKQTVLQKPEYDLRPCFQCKKRVKTIYLCSKCSAVEYCSEECQSDDWSRHKPECKFLRGKISQQELASAKAHSKMAEINLQAHDSLLAVHLAQMYLCPAGIDVQGCVKAARNEYDKAITKQPTKKIRFLLLTGILIFVVGLSMREPAGKGPVFS